MSQRVLLHLALFSGPMWLALEGCSHASYRSDGLAAAHSDPIHQRPAGAAAAASPQATTQPRRRDPELIAAIFDELHIGPKGRDPAAHEHVLRLIRAGKGVNTPAEGGMTPLQLAAGFSSSYSTVRELVEHGAMVNAPGSWGDTALHEACGFGPLATVSLLLAQGANPNARNLSGQTPLHVAAARPGFLTLEDYRLYRSTEDLRDSLLARANEPKMKSLIDELTNDLTMHAPPGWDRVYIAKALIAAGADVNAVSNSGETPLDLARSCNPNDSTLAELLILMGGRRAKDRGPTTSSGQSATNPHSQ